MAARITGPHVKKLINFPTDLWDRVLEWRFAKKAGTESEAIRQLVEIGLETSISRIGDEGLSRPTVPPPPVASEPAPKPAPAQVPDIADLVRSEVQKALGRMAPPPDDTPALDPVAEAEGLRKLAAFVERNRLPPPPPEPPEPSIEELQAKALALKAQRQKRPDFEPVPTNVVPAPGQGDTEPYVHLYPEEPRAPEERTSPYWDDEEG